MQLPTDAKERKATPIVSGVLDYFPLAVAEVARVSFAGNEQHNPGEPLHWDRNKSTDHADCLGRHLLERGQIDIDGKRHTAKAAWRVLAMLQLELEAAKAKDAPAVAADYEYEEARRIAAGEARQSTAIGFDGSGGVLMGDTWRFIDLRRLFELEIPGNIARQIAGGISYADLQPARRDFAYVAGPMRGLPQFNFPAFDEARDNLLSFNVNVISPADIDRAAGDEDSDNQKLFCLRDFFSLYFIRANAGEKGEGAYLAMLPGWESSIGAAAEFMIGRWLGLTILDARTMARLNHQDVNTMALLASIRAFLASHS